MTSPLHSKEQGEIAIQILATYKQLCAQIQAYEHTLDSFQPAASSIEVCMTMWKISGLERHLKEVCEAYLKADQEKSCVNS